MPLLSAGVLSVAMVVWKNMRWFYLLAAFSCALAVAVQATECTAQASQAIQSSDPIRVLPEPARIRSPFALDSSGLGPADSLAFLDQKEILAQDRQLLISAAPVIARKAAIAGFNLQQENWTHVQMLCPILPADLLLLYSRTDSHGSISRFSAIVPRMGRAAVRVIPIERRGDSPYTPAPESPQTIAAFNRAREKSPSNAKPDWLLTGLCYSALAGAHVELAPSARGDAAAMLPKSMPFLQIDDRMNVVRFVDVEQPQKPQDWTLTFDSEGKLVKAKVSANPMLRITMLPK